MININEDTLKMVLSRYSRLAKRFNMDNTFLQDYSFLSVNSEVKIFVKDESNNTTGSLKIRSALFNLVKAIEEHRERNLSSEGFFNKEWHFLDASSGNYAKALAYLTTELRYKCTLFVPDSFAQPFRSSYFDHDLKAALFFKGIKNSDEARIKATEYAAAHPEMDFLDQYNNDGSWMCHYYFTAEEILTELEKLGSTPTHFISGIGTGGSLIGIGKKLKEKAKTKIICLESKIPHVIKGLRSLNRENTPTVYSNSQDIVDSLQEINPDNVFSFKAEHACSWGNSACANLYAARQLSYELDKGIIATIIPDRL